MHIFWEYFSSPWMYYAQLAFTVAMLVHVYRNGSETFWYFVIFFLQPVGAWGYFLLVVVRGLLSGRGFSRPRWERKLSIAELRFRVEQAPTVNNRIALAERLMEKGEHSAAIPLLEAVLSVDQIHCGAMHDLALCHMACDRPIDAVAMLERLLQRDSRWAYYRAWRTLIDAHLACGNPLEALKACRQLERMVPTLEHKCLLAEHLLANKFPAEAIDLLDLALEEQSFAPFSKRLKNWRWSRRAQQLLKEAETA